MKLKYVYLGLSCFGFICASGLSLQQATFARSLKLQVKPIKTEQILAQNRKIKNQEQRNSIPTTLNKEFTLKVGQKGIVSRENLKISFLKVSEDSRCPANVMCITAGQTAVVLNVVGKGQNLGEVVLAIKPGAPELAVKTIGDKYSLKLIDVQPYPIAPSETKQSDYVIKLSISKARA